ncbi:MAG: PAS domain-containing protein, partial [Pseudomonadota bacterium]
MSEFKNDTGFTAIAQIEGYWDALRGARLMPKRSEIDPRGIESALEFTFVLERIAPGMARLRIAGSHLSDLMGMEVRGMPLTSFVSPGSRRQLSDAMEEVFQRPAVCELRLSAETGRDKPPMDARLIL